MTDPDTRTTQWQYDLVKGTLSAVTAPGVAIGYEYFGKTEVGPGQAPGAVKSISGPYGTNLAFSYIGKLLSSAEWAGAVNGTVSWQYDSDFARTSESITDASGTAASISFGYADLDKFLTCASLSSCPPPAGVAALSVTHDSVNGLLTNVDFGSLTETYGYDNFGTLASKIAKLGTTPLLQSTYDSPSWSVTQRRDGIGRTVHREERVLSAAQPTSFDYTYSDEGYLIGVTSSSTSLDEDYTYSNQNGNRTSAKTPLRTVSFAEVSYDSQDRLKSYGPFDYAYTNNGELLTKTDRTTGVVTTYSYDTLGNLITVAPSNGATITYLVDGMNRRIGKKVGSSLVQQWLYRDSLKPVAELDGTGHLVSVFVYGSNANVPDYVVRDQATYRILTDQIGTPRLVVNVANSSDVKFAATYTAFGELVSSSGTVGYIPFGFAGGLYDKDTGLVRFGARDYDPVVGRWISKDPILFDGGQANLYVYVNNDPVNASDPAGTGPLEIAKCVADGYSISECLDDERKLLCKNWGIACDGDTPLPPGRPAFPSGPKEPGPGECSVQDDCIDRYVKCTNRISKWDGTKGHSRCRECMIICEGQGYWPSTTGDGRLCQ